MNNSHVQNINGIATKPKMADGFLITDREDEGIKPRYLVEYFVDGQVASSKSFNSTREIALALGKWPDENGGAA